MGYKYSDLTHLQTSECLGVYQNLHLSTVLYSVRVEKL